MAVVFADAFAVGVFTALLLIFLVFVALGWWYPRRTSDITDKGLHRHWGALAEIEEQDIPMMLGELNRHRAQRGEPALSEAALREQVEAEQLQRLQAGRKRRQRERRGF